MTGGKATLPRATRLLGVAAMCARIPSQQCVRGLTKLSRERLMGAEGRSLGQDRHVEGDAEVQVVNMKCSRLREAAHQWTDGMERAREAR